MFIFMYERTRTGLEEGRLIPIITLCKTMQRFSNAKFLDSSAICRTDNVVYGTHFEGYSADHSLILASSLCNSVSPAMPLAMDFDLLMVSE